MTLLLNCPGCLSKLSRHVVCRTGRCRGPWCVMRARRMSRSSSHMISILFRRYWILMIDMFSYRLSGTCTFMYQLWFRCHGCQLCECGVHCHCEYVSARSLIGEASQLNPCLGCGSAPNHANPQWDDRPKDYNGLSTFSHVKKR